MPNFGSWGLPDRDKGRGGGGGLGGAHRGGGRGGTGMYGADRGYTRPAPAPPLPGPANYGGFARPQAQGWNNWYTGGPGGGISGQFGVLPTAGGGLWDVRKQRYLTPEEAAAIFS